MNQRRHRYLENGQLESIGGGGVVVRGDHLPWVGGRRGKNEEDYKKGEGVCHTVALPFTLKSMLRQKKNYENSNISPSKNIIFKKIL